MIFVKSESVVSLPVSDRVYSDINMDWTLEAIDTVVNGDSLTQKILFVLGTRLRSRKWRPLFGCNAPNRLFDPFDEVTASWIKTDLVNALENPNNDLVDDITDIRAVVQLGTKQTYICWVSWREPKLEKANEVKFNLRKLGAA
jgi:hypothetical protein